MGSKEEEKLFTCKDRGAHALRVWFDYTVAKHYAKTEWEVTGEAVEEEAKTEDDSGPYVIQEGA